MLSADELRRLSTRSQTTGLNTAREYAQHVFLSYLYQKRSSEKLLFKGGTALRIIYGSPRYSEDLDYTASRMTDTEVRQAIEGAIGDMRKEGFEVSMEYNKTSGGWLVLLETKVASWPVRVELNLSRRKEASKGEFHLIASPYTPPYTINALSEEELVAEKIEALLSRKKPRDYYDLYYILRSSLNKKPAIKKKRELMECAEGMDDTKIKKELKTFLPASYQPVAANLKNNLKKELTRL